ncbi:hypothetical protein FALBO_2473 [Fusarium albosuccineum]|uniref:Uncharacterized protein n=1 Tax=Fusarium albosuccineum TaxID=1237068 RepID=A0A8H4LLZ5_9HYPO|nr:hypothetical protein FALBO_2473 [Fusarium albosuccineum]
MPKSSEIQVQEVTQKAFLGRTAMHPVVLMDDRRPPPPLGLGSRPAHQTNPRPGNSTTTPFGPEPEGPKMSPTYTVSAHLYKNLFASLKERRRSSVESQQERPVLSTPFTNNTILPSTTTQTAKPADFESSFKTGETGSWASTLTQPAYSDLRKVSTK